MSIIAAIFFSVGVVDYLIGNKFGIGSSFVKGLDAIADLLIMMTGFIVAAPVIGDLLTLYAGPVFERMSCDPSILAGILLSCDGGGAVIAKEMAITEAAGLYNGMIIGAFMGITLVFTVPLVLVNTSGRLRDAAVQGLLIGFVTIPIGCIITGILCRFPVEVIINNTLPVLAVSLLFLILFFLLKDRVTIVFRMLSFTIRTISLSLFTLAVIQELTQTIFVSGMNPLNEAFSVIGNIGVFLAGILCFLTVLQKVLHRSFEAVAKLLQINDKAVMGFFVTLANPISVLNDMESLEEKECMMNAAFMVSACFAVGDHLAFALQFSPEIAIQLMIGKIVTGILGIVLAMEFWRYKESRFDKNTLILK